MVNLKKIKNQRGFVFIEFAIALPLMMLLLYSLGSVNLTIHNTENEQAANYTLETEAQEILDRLAKDARAAYKITIKKNGHRVIFMCNAHSGDSNTFKNAQDIRVYDIHTPKNDAHSHIYFKRADDEKYTAPLTGKTSYGETFISKLNFSRLKGTDNVLHIDLEMGESRVEQTVKMSTAVYAPACKRISDTRDSINE